MNDPLIYTIQNALFMNDPLINTIQNALFINDRPYTYHPVPYLWMTALIHTIQCPIYEWPPLYIPSSALFMNDPLIHTIQSALFMNDRPYTYHPVPYLWMNPR